jgi:hypothetical protein
MVTVVEVRADTFNAVGVAGALPKVTAEVEVKDSDVPTAVTVETLNQRFVPDGNPVIFIARLFDAMCGTGFQVPPPSLDISTR